MRRSSRFVLGAILVSECVLGQQDFAGVEIRAMPVAGKVYMLEGRGGNIGVSVGSDGVLIVDDQFAPLADRIQAALTKLGGDKPKFILNTHWHADHVGGNPHFGRHGTIIAHANVRERLARAQELFGRTVEPLPKEGLPVVTFDDSLTVHFNDEEIRVFHLPNGHTDGDCVVHFTKSNVVHTGDHMFAGMFPFVDLDHGGNVEGMTKNIARLINLLPADVKIIPGHGPISTLDDLKTFHQMMVETTEVVKTRMAEGRSLEQIKAEGLPDPWETWGGGFINTDAWLATIYDSLSKSRKPAD